MADLQNTHDFFWLWAKTPDREGNTGSARFHPLCYHSLDVAAVAEQLLGSNRLARSLGDRLQVPWDDFRRLIIFLASLHDIGKASVSFQALAPDVWPGRTAAGFGACPDIRTIPSGIRHDSITAYYLKNDKDRPILQSTMLAHCGALYKEHSPWIIDPVAGHHGRPARDFASFEGTASTLNKPFRLAMQAMVAELRGVLRPGKIASDCPLDDQLAAVFSWMLSSLLPVADWIGSNQAWFAPREPDLSLLDYWEQVARPCASRAMRESGLCAARVAPASVGRTLQHLVAGEGASLSPLQKFAFDMPVAGNGLWIIEDATGAGKTEAALAMAHRLMAAGHADGFYFALPTMATANAMYARLVSIYRAMFEDADVASLVLAHGRAGQHTDFLRSISHMDQAPLQEGQALVSGYCAAWLPDSRRKALLAQAGAGTIDQAVLAVLPSKYQSLRVYGLASKVLIIDEIHAADPFLLREIEGLLTLHAMLGGSAILMSATLPMHTRQGLIRAFAEGHKCTAPKVSSSAYPLVTRFSAEGLQETALDLAPRSQRRVSVRRIATVAEAEELALSLAARGAAVALIRSAVDAAIASYDRIAARMHEIGVGADLFHARFLFEDRDAIERRVVRRFGKDGLPDERRGRVVVSTQVIEQSLDLDFDVLITDLAPVDLIIQRAGRLWRHQRAGRPVTEPIVHVISPEPISTAKEDWLDRDLVEAKWVYGDAARLWLSARVLFDAGAIETSTLGEEGGDNAHVRRLVEAVYAAEPEALPTESLRAVLGTFEGHDMAKKTVAGDQLLKAGQGYVRDSKAWLDDLRAVTRLELVPRVPVRLAQSVDGQIVPLGPDWTLSELRLTKRVAQGLSSPKGGMLKHLSPPWREPDEGICLLVLAEEAEGIWRSNDGAFSYDAEYGLRRLVAA